MRKTLRQLHFEIKHIMDLSVQELNTVSKKELLGYLKELKWNCKYVEAEKKRHTNSNNIISNAEARVLDIEHKMEIISKILNKEEIQKNKDNTQRIAHPFVDDEMLAIFNYIIEKWNYNKDIKYAYIYNELMHEGDSPSKYEKYIRDNYKQIIKFNYNNATSKTIIKNLRQIMKNK